MKKPRPDSRFVGMQPKELLAEREIVDAELRLTHQDEDGQARNLTPHEQHRFDSLLLDRDDIDARLAQHGHMRDVVSRYPRALVDGGSSLRDPGHGLEFDTSSDDVLAMGAAQVRGDGQQEPARTGGGRSQRRTRRTLPMRKLRSSPRVMRCSTVRRDTPSR